MVLQIDDGMTRKKANKAAGSPSVAIHTGYLIVGKVRQTRRQVNPGCVKASQVSPPCAAFGIDCLVYFGLLTGRRHCRWERAAS